MSGEHDLYDVETIYKRDAKSALPKKRKCFSTVKVQKRPATRAHALENAQNKYDLVLRVVSTNAGRPES